MHGTEIFLARPAIEELNVEFACLIDHGQSEMVTDLFTFDGSYGGSTGERSVGRDEIRRPYASRGAKGPRTTRHTFMNLRLALQTPDRASGACIMTLFAEDGVSPNAAEPFLVADYNDIYGLHEHKRPYASRLITWLFMRRDGKVPPLPLGLSNETRLQQCSS
jgi:hypothetical protein